MHMHMHICVYGRLMESMTAVCPTTVLLQYIRPGGCLGAAIARSKPGVPVSPRSSHTAGS